MKKCPSCKQEYEDSRVYCANCGALLETVKTKEPIKPPPTPPEPHIHEKRRSRATPVLIVLIVLLMLALVVVCVLAKQEIDTLSWERDDWEDRADRYRRQANEYEEQVEDRDAQIYDLQSDLWYQENLADFYEEYARVVPDDASGLYHRYSCSDLDTSDGFWIYNINAALDHADPCPECCADDTVE